MSNTPLLSTTQIHAIADLVIDRALVIFETMGYEKDFCVQSVGEVAVFGGANRLIFNPKLGYYPDAGRCSPQFLAAYDRHYGTTEPEPELSKVNSKLVTKFFHFSQNNSGGSFVTNDMVCETVIIEARDVDDANNIAVSKGIYFDGVDEGSDCECCGDRWNRVWDDGDDVPSIYGTPVSEVEAGMFRKRAIIHYLDGRVDTVVFPTK
jgi:hypothetical protein